jgi:hypothetical protein
MTNSPRGLIVYSAGMTLGDEAWPPEMCPILTTAAAAAGTLRLTIVCSPGMN